MALVPCPDCGRDVSSEAPACPGCGRPMKSEAPPVAAPPPVASPVAPPPKKMSGFKKGCLYVGGAVIALFLVIGLLPTMLRGCGSPSPAATPALTKAQAAEAEKDFKAKEAAAAAANKEAAAQAGRDAAAEKKGLASLEGINNTFARAGRRMIDSTQMFTKGGKRGVILNLVPSSWDRMGEYERRQFLHLDVWPLIAKEMRVSVVEFKCVGKPLGRIENNTFFEP